jgi:hypothetical protein
LEFGFQGLEIGLILQIGLQRFVLFAALVGDLLGDVWWFRIGRSGGIAQDQPHGR